MEEIWDSHTAWKGAAPQIWRSRKSSSFRNRRLPKAASLATEARSGGETIEDSSVIVRRGSIVQPAGSCSANRFDFWSGVLGQRGRSPRRDRGGQRQRAAASQDGDHFVDGRIPSPIPPPGGLCADLFPEWPDLRNTGTQGPPGSELRGQRGPRTLRTARGGGRTAGDRYLLGRG